MKQGVAMGGRALAVYLMGLVLNALVGMGLSDKWYAMQVGLNAVLLCGMALMMYADGANRGERACTLAATAQRVAAEGKTLDPKSRTGIYEPKAILSMWLVAALPLALVAAVNLIAEPMYPPVIISDAPIEIESAQVAGEEEAEAYLNSLQALEPQAPEAQGAAEDQAPDRPLNWPNIAARALFMTVIAAYRLFRQNPHGLNLLFLAVALIYPLPEALGYLSGPRMRQKKLTAIETGKKRKMRNLKVNKKPRAPRPPKVEV